MTVSAVSDYSVRANDGKIVVIAAAVRMTDIFFIMIAPFLRSFRYPEGYTFSFFSFTSNTIETEDIIHEKIFLYNRKLHSLLYKTLRGMRTRVKQKSVAKAAAPGVRVPRAELFALSIF